VKGKLISRYSDAIKFIQFQSSKISIQTQKFHINKTKGNINIKNNITNQLLYLNNIYWIQVTIRSTSHLDAGFLGFLLSVIKC